MAALLFPPSPTVGDRYTPGPGQPVYIYRGEGVWVCIGIGSGGSPQAFSLAVGQTVVAVTYKFGAIEIFRNGSRLVETQDFIATNGSSVTLVEPGRGGLDQIIAIPYSVLSTVDALRASLSGSDIPDKAAFRNNVGQGRVRVFDEKLTVAKSEVIISLDGYSKFEVDVEILIAGGAGNAAFGWQCSFDNGATFKSAATEYTYVFSRANNVGSTPVSGQAGLGFITQTWEASVLGVPALGFGRFFKGDATRVPVMRSDYAIYAASGGLDEVGSVNARVTSISGAATHLKLKTSSGAAALGIGSRITVEGKQ